MPWSAGLVCDPSVILGDFNYDGKSYRIALYFTSDDDEEAGGIGLALSNDGSNWTVLPQPLIVSEHGPDGSYGAGEGGVAWGPTPGLIVQAYTDTTGRHAPQTVLYKDSTDGITFQPSPAIVTELSHAFQNGGGRSPELSYFSIWNTWFAAEQDLSGGDPDAMLRLLLAAEANDLFGAWTTMASLDYNDPLTGEEIQLLPSFARSENSGLYVDADGWAYVFLTVGNHPNSGQGVLTWRVAQARLRVLEDAKEVIADQFKQIGQNRKQGDPVHDLDAEIGARRWNASADAVLRGGRLESSVGGGSPLADFPFVAQAHPEVTDISLSATFDLEGVNWSAVGFSSGPNQGMFAGQLGGLINTATSKLEIWIQGLGTLVANPSLSNLQPGLNRLDLIYNKAGNVVSALVNGHEPTPGFSVDLDLHSFVPNIQTAYVQMFLPTFAQSGVEEVWLNRPGLFSDGFELGSTVIWSSECPPACL